MRERKLFVKENKCEFGASSVEHLGHFVGQGKRWMDPAKVQVVVDWPPPTSHKEVQRFMGLANYYA